MRWMIASDIHGDADCCKQVLEAFEREGAARLLLLGDLLYHGPRNELPEKYGPKEVAAMLNGQKEKLLCVRGNCEAEVDQMMLEFPVMADYAILYWEGHLIFATHGHRWNRENPPFLNKGDILLNGHTHIPAWEEREEGWTYLNPGSAALPKGESTRSYLLLEGADCILKALDGTVIWKKRFGE